MAPRRITPVDKIQHLSEIVVEYLDDCGLWALTFFDQRGQDLARILRPREPLDAQFDHEFKGVKVTRLCGPKLTGRMNF